MDNIDLFLEYASALNLTNAQFEAVRDLVHACFESNTGIKKPDPKIIAKVQKMLGVPADGIIGKVTKSAIQKVRKEKPELYAKIHAMLRPKNGIANIGEQKSNLSPKLVASANDAIKSLDAAHEKIAAKKQSSTNNTEVASAKTTSNDEQV